MADSFASEAAKARAEELGVDIDEVEGTGANGNVKVSDVDAFAESRDGEGDASSQEAAEGEGFEPPPEPVAVILNPSANIGAYDFGEDVFPVEPKSSIRAGETRMMDHEGYARYSKVKLNGVAVIVKA